MKSEQSQILQQMYGRWMFFKGIYRKQLIANPSFLIHSALSVWMRYVLYVYVFHKQYWVFSDNIVSH